MIRQALVISALLSAFVARGAPSQELVWEATGVQLVSGFAGPIAVLGDLNGDGYDDIVNLGFDPSFLQPPGQLFFFSGKDGSILRTTPPTPHPTCASRKPCTGATKASLAGARSIIPESVCRMYNT